MTEDQFRKKRFHGFMSIDYSNSRIKNPDGEYGVIIPCMLVALDFDECILTLQPFPNESYKEDEFTAYCENCEISKPKLKAVTK